ncbi:hypothetical protein AMTR_s00109p00063250 [Amborella trichopoda]|uniref:Pentatricopeptide repeat-containing protein n=1 Tax=Amborella trichopoda TaxID=13333 RepID=W1NV96_AMBTC|nr:hypothetical protein AMTR_s00109p00063250 [Amborella trichopoda]
MPSIEQEFRVSESSFLCKCNFVSCPSMDAWYGFNGWVVCLGFPKSKHLLEIDEFSWLTAGRNSRVFKFPGFNRWKDEVIDALVNNINSQASTVRKIEEAINLLQAMYQDGVEPNIITYNSLLNGLCKDGKIEEAIKLFELMYQGSMEPDVIIYNALLNGLCRKGLVDEGRKRAGFYNKMICW